MTEERLQESVVHLMRAYGRPDVCWFAVPNGEQRRRSTGARLKRQGVIAGAPDMVFLIDGVMHGVELKVGVNIVRPNQSAFGKWIEVAGGRYHVCTGIYQTFECLKAIAAIPNHVKLIFQNPVEVPLRVKNRVYRVSRTRK